MMFYKEDTFRDITTFSDKAFNKQGVLAPRFNGDIEAAKKELLGFYDRLFKEIEREIGGQKFKVPPILSPDTLKNNPKLLLDLQKEINNQLQLLDNKAAQVRLDALAKAASKELATEKKKLEDLAKLRAEGIGNIEESLKVIQAIA